VSPTDPDTVYAGSFFNQGLFKSSNARGWWEGLAAGLDPAGLVSDIVIDPTSPNVVHVGTYNLGVYYSTD
jgi:hypothetical protein